MSEIKGPFTVVSNDAPKQKAPVAAFDQGEAFKNFKERFPCLHRIIQEFSGYDGNGVYVGYGLYLHNGNIGFTLHKMNGDIPQEAGYMNALLRIPQNGRIIKFMQNINSRVTGKLAESPDFFEFDWQTLKWNSLDVFELDSDESAARHLENFFVEMKVQRHIIPDFPQLGPPASNDI